MPRPVQRESSALPMDPQLEADIKLGERTAFIPMTCQEKVVLDRIEAGLHSAAALWRHSSQQQDADKLLTSAMRHWHGAAGQSSVDTRWMWEVGRWSCEFTLPFAAELRRHEPAAMRAADQMLAESTCLRNRKVDFARKVQRQQLEQQQLQQQEVKESNNKRSQQKTQKPKPASIEDLEDDPCLCQIRWGLAPDTEAAKRRQLDKVAEDKLLEKMAAEKLQQQQLQQQQPKQKSKKKQRQQVSPPAAAAAPAAPAAAATAPQGPKRAIVKTSHLRHDDDFNRELGDYDDCRSSGYASHETSPRQNFINEVMSGVSCNSSSSSGSSHINEFLRMSTNSYQRLAVD